jgi:hypothetical protein
MKKRLLSLAAVALTTLSGFAFEEGEIVYTPQGKFQITSSDNICTNGLFAEGTDGWNSLEGEETPETLCSRCSQYAKDWEPTAQKLWEATGRPIVFSR